MVIENNYINNYEVVYIEESAEEIKYNIADNIKYTPNYVNDTPDLKDSKDIKENKTLEIDDDAEIFS
ncbi:MAG: hypothetical protein PHN42_02770 [Bacilli bacterium]|nr:hypothetical protein [Bacilli bacterium]